MFNFLKKKRKVDFHIQVVLIDSEGFEEFLLFDFPEDLDQFISMVNDFNKSEEYRVELRPYGEKEINAFIKSALQTKPF